MDVSFPVRRFLLAATAAALVSAVAGCAMGPDYQRPQIETPETYRWQPGGEAPGSVADLQWWNLYQDPALQALVRQALEQNLDVRIAAARVEQAQAVAGTQWIAYVPQVGVDASVGREKVPANQVPDGADRTGNSDSVSVGLSWELDLWGRIRRLNEAARAQLLGAEYARQGVMVGLVAEVASTYFQLMTLDEQLRITRDTVGIREKFLELTKAQFERGVVSGLDVSTAEAQLATARATIPDFERQIAQTENRLALLLGRNPQDVARTADTAAPGVVPDVPAGLPSQLVARRPDLLETEQALVAANAQVGAAKAALFPTISLTGMYGSASSKLSDLFTGPAETWSASVGLVQPILDVERNLYAVDLADARKREALLTYERSVRGAFREVADALVSRKKFGEQQQEQAALVDALQRSDDIAMKRYKLGYSSYFEVINAERDLFGAKLSLSTVRLNALQSTVELYRALGGGWDPAAVVADGR